MSDVDKLREMGYSSTLDPYGIKITYPEKSDMYDRYILTASVVAHINSFTQLEGVSPEPINIYIISPESFYVSGVLAIGGYFEQEDSIVVWRGVDNEIPALYHEFCHQMFDRKGHYDNRWTIWEKRRKECVNSILRSHFR
jgi:hypothetical protein